MQIRSGVLLVTLFLLQMVFFAGCIGADYVANRDIVVIKLDPDGNPLWARTIDTGYDDSARDLIEIPGGDLVVAGGRTPLRIGAPLPRLVRLSPDGTVLWDRVLGNDSSELTAVTSAADGGFAAVSYDGRIWRLDPEGNVTWNRSSGIEQVWSVIDTGDEGFVTAGVVMDRVPFGTVPVYNADGTVASRPPFNNESVVTPGCHETSVPVGPDRTISVTECTVPYTIVLQGSAVNVAADGNISWTRAYGAEGLRSAWSVLADTEREGYLLAGFQENGAGQLNATGILRALRLDGNGTPGWVTTVDFIEYYLPPIIRSGPEGYDLLFIHTTIENGYLNNKPAVVHLGLNGSVSTPMIVKASVITTWTTDNGFFSAGFPSEAGSGDYGEAIYGRAESYPLHAIRLDPDGILLWERVIPGIVVNSVRKVIQTSDGGYAILALKEN